MKESLRTVIEPTHEEIAHLAYRFFEESGRKHGHDMDHWLQAHAHVCTDCKHVGPANEKRERTNEV